jgi:hypothetical protein
MGERTALAARAAAIPWRLATYAATISLALGALLAYALTGPRASSVPGAHAPSVRALLSSLPLTARAPVSATLGATDPRYRVVPSAGGGYGARNPAQRLGVSFQPGQVLLSSGATQVGLSLRGVGFGSSLGAVDRTPPRAQANRVRYAHAGLSEWYVNGPLGLEQGFTVARAPARSASAPLTLSLAISGDVHAALVAGAESIVFTSRRGPSLRYGDLMATDERGRLLRSWLVLQGGRVLLRIDARGARYPLRIDPLAEQATLAGHDEGLLGYSVALSEDASTALVGAPRENGGAWIFVRSGATWTLQKELTNEEAGASTAASPETCGGEEPGELNECGGFGRSVALSADGNTALIGAPRADEATGYARVFVRKGSTWERGETLTGGLKNGHFGKSVALSGNGMTALVGAPSSRSSAGAAWVFTREGEGSTWSKDEQLTGGLASGEGHFGVSVALNGDGTTALVGGPTTIGATWDESKGAFERVANAGAAWVFTRPSAEVPFAQEGQRLSVTGEGEGEREIGEGRLGYSVALSSDGDTALIGARTDDEGDGAAWVFTRSSAGEFKQGAKLTAGTGAPIAFGYSVALSGDATTALIGSPRTLGGAGAAWLFTGSASTWSEREELLGGAAEAGAGSFGVSVALSGDGERALVGAPTNGDGAGAAIPFDQGPAVTEVTPDEGPQAGGTPVTITGVGFAEAQEVKFGSNEVHEFTVNPQGTAITTVTPAGKEQVFVTVKTPAGTSVQSTGAQYTYLPPGSRKADVPSPVVRSVSPDEGPAAGGTSVTIEGANFEEGAVVDFGSVAASAVHVEGTTITAVSPAQSPGTVDVTVTTPMGGTSATKAKDRFTFLASSQSTGGSGAGSASTSAAAAAVLGFGPQIGASCAVALRSKGIAVSASKRATVKLSSVALAFSGRCTGRLTIEVKVKLKTKKGHKPRFGAQAIGTASFSIPSGRSATVTVKLNRAGRALLASHHGRLSAKLVILAVLPGPARAHSAIVHLALVKSRAAKHKPKPGR